MDSRDNTEDLLKRYKSVKHTGEALPGHGGWLDRIDSHVMVLAWLARVRNCCVKNKYAFIFLSANPSYCTDDEEAYKKAYRC